MALLKVRDVAQVLNLTDRTVQRLLQYGVIKGIKVGAEWRIPEERVLQYVENNINIKGGK